MLGPFDTNGPLLSFNHTRQCCGAARHCSHSCRAQHFVGWNINQRDKDDVRQGFESVEIIGLDRLRVTSGMA
jgi:hypothetical protein